MLRCCSSQNCTGLENVSSSGRNQQRIDRLGNRGFAFNMLTSYSDPDRMRSDLFYGDPRHFFDHAKRTFSKQVALLHDYGLYEFTILVRR